MENYWIQSKKAILRRWMVCSLRRIHPSLLHLRFVGAGGFVVAFVVTGGCVTGAFVVGGLVFTGTGVVEGGWVTGAFVGPTIVVEAMGLGGTFMVVPLPDEKSMKQGTWSIMKDKQHDKGKVNKWI